MAQRMHPGPGIGGHRGTSEGYGFDQESLQFKGRWPSIKIVRSANYEVPEAEAWNVFMNHLGARNYLKGTGRSLGSLACTYVSAREFAAMIEKKYDQKLTSNRSDSLQLMRRISRNYNQFVDDEGQTGLKLLVDLSDFARTKIDSDVAMAAQSDEEIEDQFLKWCEEDELPFDEQRAATEERSDKLLWGIGSFVVNGLDSYGHNKIGLDLSGNEQLYKERDKTVDFFRAEGFDTGLIDRSRAPHLTVFQSFDLVSRTMLVTLDTPRKIVLNPPKALVSNPLTVPR